MRCTIVLEFDDGDGTVAKRVEVMRLHRATENPTSGDVGLSLAEGKSLVNCVQQEFVVEQLERFCASRRACVACGTPRRLHDSRCSELKTTLGKVFYCRERWKACACGADAARYVSPLKSYLTDVSTGELRWLHAELGATMPYRQAKRVMDLLLPTSGRDSHVTIRNHTVAVGKSIQYAQPVRRWCEKTKPNAELGIDVGYVRRARSNVRGLGEDNRAETGKRSSSIAVVVAPLLDITARVGPCPGAIFDPIFLAESEANIIGTMMERQLLLHVAPGAFFEFIELHVFLVGAILHGGVIHVDQ